jgi:ribokinase
VSVGFDVVVVGSVNVDMVVHASALPSPGSTVTGGVFERHGGGKGANQAVAAARLGARVALIAAVGDDDAGREAIEELRREGVEVSRVVQIDDVATGVALIVVDRNGENQIAVASGANEHLDGAMVKAVLSEITLRDGGVCLIGFEVGDLAIEAAATWASSHGHAVVLDPAPARPLSLTLTASKPIATPNEGELLELTGETETAVAATSLSQLTRNSVVVTLGSEGALLHDGGVLTAIAPFKTTAVDSTGAGDAFTGALAVGLAEGSSIVDAVDLAQATAALSVRSEGARSGMPSRESVEEIIEK